MPTLRRRDLQVVAQAKIDDAEFLLGDGRFGNAYYLAGYAVEIGLKACVAKEFVADTIPDRRRVMDIHVHDLKKLVGLAGLLPDLQRRERTSRLFAANWAIVTDWTPETRYDSIDAATARSMVVAVADSRDGALPWIKTHW